MLETLATAVALAMDAAAAAALLGLALPRVRAVDALKVGLTFGGFQAFMPLLGFWLGRTVYGMIEPVDHWIAFGLLTLLGVRMMLDARKPREEQSAPAALTARTLLPLGVATSIDALTVGVSLAMDSADIAHSATVIGLVTLLLSMASMRLGRMIGARIRTRAQTVGGLLLVAMGVKVLMDHLR